MKRLNALKTWVFVLLAGVVMCLQGCTQSSDKKPKEAKGGILVVGTSGDNPPFEIYDTTTQQLKGFDIDYVNLVADKLGRKVVFKNMDFNALIPALLSKRIDIIAAALTKTPERTQKVAFAEPYLTSTPVVVLPKKMNAHSAKDLASLKVGAQTGTTHEQSLKKIQKELFGQLTIVSMNKVTEMIQELKVGRINALLVELDVGTHIVGKESDWRYFSLPEYVEPYAFATRLDDPLTAQLSQVVKDLAGSAEVEALKKKWFQK